MAFAASVNERKLVQPKPVDALVADAAASEGNANNNAAVSTSVQTRIRSPPERMISICPDDFKPRSCIASAVIVTGRIRVRSFVSINSNPSCRRHVNRRFAFRS